MNFLGITCRCGRSASVPCPTIADLTLAAGEFADWYDGDGNVCCQECRLEPVPQALIPAHHYQADLFSGEAA